MLVIDSFCGQLSLWSELSILSLFLDQLPISAASPLLATNVPQTLSLNPSTGNMSLTNP